MPKPVCRNLLTATIVALIVAVAWFTVAFNQDALEHWEQKVIRSVETQ